MTVTVQDPVTAGAADAREGTAADLGLPRCRWASRRAGDPVARHATATGPLPAATRVAVVGSGLSGIGTAVALRRAGIEDFVVLERAGSLGGTWRDNTYPGAACDVPSHLYSFSSAPRPDCRTSTRASRRSGPT